VKEKKKCIDNEYGERRKQEVHSYKIRREEKQEVHFYRKRREERERSAFLKNTEKERTFDRGK